MKKVPLKPIKHGILVNSALHAAESWRLRGLARSESAFVQQSVEMGSAERMAYAFELAIKAVILGLSETDKVPAVHLDEGPPFEIARSLHDSLRISEQALAEALNKIKEVTVAKLSESLSPNVLRLAKEHPLLHIDDFIRLNGDLFRKDLKYQIRDYFFGALDFPESVSDTGAILESTPFVPSLYQGYLCGPLVTLSYLGGVVICAANLFWPPDQEPYAGAYKDRDETLSLFTFQISSPVENRDEYVLRFSGKSIRFLPTTLGGIVTSEDEKFAPTNPVWRLE